MSTDDTRRQPGTDPTDAPPAEETTAPLPEPATDTTDVTDEATVGGGTHDAGADERADGADQAAGADEGEQAGVAEADEAPDAHATQPIAPSDATQPLPPADATRPLPSVDATRPLPSVDETQPLAAADATQPIPPADAPLALSAVSSAAAARVEAVFETKVAVVPNGLDLDAWAPAD
ncbi:hypothetical protein OMK64_19955, partial [Cellulomonas fimi]|nr:hypothetical protein [Cellulomonas fimi]